MTATKAQLEKAFAHVAPVAGTLAIALETKTLKQSTLAWSIEKLRAAAAELEKI